MGYSPRIDRFAKTIDQDEREEKVQTSFKLNESIMISLNSVAKATGVSKTHLINNLLDIGLTELCEALEGNRPDLIVEVIDDARPVYDFLSPAAARQLRDRFGNSVQIDLEDAIKEEEEKKHGMDSSR